MHFPLRHAILGFVTTLTIAAVNVAAADVTGSFRETLDVSSPLELEVSTGLGNIAIRQGPAGEVHIVGEVRAHAGYDVRENFLWFSGSEDAEEFVSALVADPPIELSGNKLRIGPVSNRDDPTKFAVSYEITVPADTVVRSRTGSGSQIVAGIAAPVTVQAGSGEITLRDIRGDVRANAGGSGAIHAEGIAGAFSGSTGSGPVTLDQTVSAAIDITTASGSITVRLPRDAAFELDARTGSGEVTEARSSVGTGGPPLRVRTGSGEVRIE